MGAIGIMKSTNDVNLEAKRIKRRGIAMVPVMLIVSGLAVFTMALLTATMSGNRTIVYQADDHRLTSGVESASMLAVERLWTGYLTYLEANGLPQTIENYRAYMNLAGIPDESDTFDEDGDGIVELVPGPEDGVDYLVATNLPARNGEFQINNVNIDAVQVVRVDVSPDTTQLFLTISASTTKGDGLVNPIRNRAVQQVYTVEPSDFDGFEFAMLANNINCIFCHTNVDSVERWFNTDPDQTGTFDRVRVGSLESLVVRHDMNNKSWVVDDYDADSFIAGTIYSRGLAILHDGSAIPDWDDLSLRGYEFDSEGKIVESFGLNVVTLSPAGDPPDPLENIYLNYAGATEEQVDGPMPDYFPAPIPDNGGIDPLTGLPDPDAIGNRLIDDAEFAKVAEEATGAITAGVVNVSDPETKISTQAEYVAAVFTGNTNSINQSVTGNVVLTGTQIKPIQIDGTVVIDGDLIIKGWVRGEGAIVVRGNVYIPNDLVYFDDFGPDGRTFGEGGGNTNAIGITAGGNIMIGDYQRPSAFNGVPLKLDIVTGNPDTGDPAVDKWSFMLTEMAIFNRAEWAITQEFLPGLGDDIDDPATWTAVNPNYDADYLPRYYGYGEDTIIPIQNRSVTTVPDPFDPNAPYLYFDPALNSWLGDEAALGWYPEVLNMADPNDPNDPYLTDGAGNPIAVTSHLTPNNDWIDADLYQLAMEWFAENRDFESVPGMPSLEGEPMMIDALLYTNNAIFSIVNRDTNMLGRMIVNGSLVAADLGMLVPGNKNGTAMANPNLSSLSGYQIGLQLNYDKRVKKLLNVTNPNEVQLKRTLWNPTANLFTP